MNSTAIRFVIAAGIIYYALTGGGRDSLPVMPDAYSGSMAALHSSSRSMDSHDRAVMSAAFTTASDMLAADQRNIVSDTQKAQDFAVGVLSFSYVGVGQPATKYPMVADAVEAELKKAYGDEVKALTSSDKQRIVEVLDEIGRAVL